MITPDFLRRITERTEAATARLNEYLTNKVVRHILNVFYRDGRVDIMPSRERNVRQMMETGRLTEEIKEEIARRTPGIENEVRRAFRDVERNLGEENTQTTAQVLGEEATQADVEQAGKLTPKEQRLMERAYNATNGTIHNLTGTTAEVWQKEFIDACDEAYWKATHGISVNQAVREAIDRVAQTGSMVQYPSGHRDTIEVAVARAVRTGVNQAAGDVTLTRCAETGAGHVIVSAHLGARVTDRDEPANHASWQGKVYALDWKKDALAKYNPTIQEEEETKARGFLVFQKLRDKFKIFKKKQPDYPDFVEVTGYGTGEGLCGWNCRHTFDIFYPGINTNNKPQFDSEENKRVYDLSQRQRSIERVIRKTKRRLNAAQEAFDGTGDIAQRLEMQMQIDRLERLLERQMRGYEDFVKKNNLKLLTDRLYVAKRYGVPDTETQMIPETTSADMFRKGRTHRRKTENGVEIVDEATYNKLINPVLKNGGEVRRGDPDIEEHLRKNDAFAVTIGNTILFSKNATVSDVLEETYHFMQNIKGINSDKDAVEMHLLNEIEAQKYLLSMIDKYRIPEDQTALTIDNLRKYEKLLEEYYESH